VLIEKKNQLRDIWLTLVDAAPPSPSSSPTPTAPEPPARAIKKHSHKLLSPATPTLPLTPPPQSPRSPPSTLRLRSKAKKPRSPSDGSTFAIAQSLPPRSHPVERNPFDDDNRIQDFGTVSSPSAIKPEADTEADPRVRVDVLNWLGRATLDVIGLAGFGYAFDALVDDQNVLAAAFAEVFSAARKFRVIMVLQAWFPILHYFVSTHARLSGDGGDVM